jgi:hypothetical protein
MRKEMLDQNTTTLIAGIIGGATGLIGSLLPIHLNNRHTAKMEKIKKTNKIVEEVYQALITTNDLVVSFGYKASKTKDTVNIVDKIEEIRSSTVRTRTLIKIYLPSLRSTFEEYMSTLGEYENTIGQLQDNKGIKHQTKPNELLMDFVTMGKKYRERLDNLFAELEELVK